MALFRDIVIRGISKGKLSRHEQPDHGLGKEREGNEDHKKKREGIDSSEGPFSQGRGVCQIKRKRAGAHTIKREVGNVKKIHRRKRRTHKGKR